MSTKVTFVEVEGVIFPMSVSSTEVVRKTTTGVLTGRGRIVSFTDIHDSPLDSRPEEPG